jgi:hypothetical protein
LRAESGDEFKLGHYPGFNRFAFLRFNKQRCFVGKRRSCVNDRRKLSIFDIVIIAMVASAFIFPVVLITFGGVSSDSLKAHIWWINLASVAMATILLVWMFFGGKNSPVWRFFRPPDVMWVRWAAVIALFVTSIVGACVRP